MIIFTGWRCLQYFFLKDMIQNTATDIYPAFLIGVWFDNVIASYITIIPLTVVLIFATFGKHPHWVRRFVYGWYLTLFSLAFAISAANIPYFRYFYKTINSSIFSWFTYVKTTTGMLSQEKSFLIFILAFFVVLFLYAVIGLLINKWYKKSVHQSLYGRRPLPPTMSQFFTRVIVTLLLMTLCIYGIRGRTGRNPIKVSQSYYCHDTFLNQLGLSPTFYLFRSVLDDFRKENALLQLKDEDESLRFARRSLGVTSNDPLSPMQRTLTTSGSPRKYNVVLILMESLTAQAMQTFGQTERITPCIDSLFANGYSFASCYSAGTHTNMGITATLYSQPAMMKRNLMKGAVIPKYTGIPNVLKKNGYNTAFFMTHESQYDNMKGFLTANGYQQIYAQEDYPAKEVVNSFGVPDKFLYSYALKKIDDLAKSPKPFFATVLTISNHPPYILPKDFKTRSKDIEKQIIEYCDHSLSLFMKACSKKPWFDNTIFVLLGDHGKKMDAPDGELPTSFNHIPLIFYGNPIIPQIRNDVAGQIDVMPTLLSLLNIGYTFEGFGIDLNRHKRQQIFYSADDVIAARDSASCYLYNPQLKKDFYYKTGNYGKLHEKRDQKGSTKLKDYVLYMTQTAQKEFLRHMAK